MKLKYLEYVFLFFAILLGLALRTYNLSTNPPGFFADEAAIGYNAYSLLTTGRDEHGVLFPIFFKSFNDYKAPVAIYATVPFILVLGLSEYSIRLVSVFFGIGTIIAIYFLGKELYSKQVGIFASYISAITPWLIHYDRVAFLVNTYTFFFVLTLYFFLKARKNTMFLIFAALCAGISFYTYQPAKLQIPLMIVALSILYRKLIFEKKKIFFKSVLAFFLLSLPLLASTLAGEAFQRLEYISLYSSDLSKIEMLKKATTNYITQFSPQYLFFTGENTFITRHFTHGLYPLLPSMILFVSIGLLKIFSSLRNKSSQFLLIWLFIYPIAGLFVFEPPFTNRSIIGAPLFVLLTAQGITQIMIIVKKYIRRGGAAIAFSLITIILLINTFQFTTFYFSKYPSESFDYWGWQYGAKDVMSYFLSKKNSYDDLYISGDFNQTEIFLKFYDPNDKCGQKCKVADVTKFPQIYQSSRRQLFSLTEEAIRKSSFKDRFQLKHTVYYPHGPVAFVIGEIVE